MEGVGAGTGEEDEGLLSEGCEVVLVEVVDFDFWLLLVGEEEETRHREGGRVTWLAAVWVYLRAVFNDATQFGLVAAGDGPA